MNIIWVIGLIILLSLNLFDIISTTIILNNGGKELNPVINLFIGVFGYPIGIIIPKIIFICLFIFSSYTLINKKPKVIIVALYFMNLYYLTCMYLFNYQYLKFILQN